MTSVVQKEDLDSIVVELTHSFATPKESKDIANVQRIRADYDQYFQKSQAEIKQLVKDCNLRVKKAEAATKLPYDNNESTAATLKKQIAATHTTNSVTEGRIEELKQINEQVSQEALIAAENANLLAKVANQSLPYDRHTLTLYEKMTNTVWDYSSPNIKGCIQLVAAFFL